MEINIKEILDSIKSANYVILRSGEDLLSPREGSDIDILSEDVSRLITLLISYLRKEYATNGYVIRKTIDNNHTHIDILKEDVLILRFDIVDNLELQWPGHIAKYMLESKVSKNDLNFPSPEFDVFTRMLEYLNNPVKERHLEYVKEKLQ